MSGIEEIEQAMLSFINGRFPKAAVAATDDIFTLGYVTSMFAMELVVHVEKTYGFTVPRKELQLGNFRTARSIAQLVDRNLALQGQSR